jgi:hypothetical protein
MSTATESNGNPTGASKLADETRCRQMLADGRRCGGRRLRGSELCLWHDPEEARQQAQRRLERRTQNQEGEASRVELLALSEKQYLEAGELRAVLARTLARLEREPISPGVAYATGYLVHLLLSLGAPPLIRKRLEDMTPEEREARHRELRRQVRLIYGWSPEEAEKP